MPSVSVKIDADEWHRWAVKYYTICVKGPGSAHRRVDVLKQAGLDIAAENFRAGQSAGALEAAQSLGENQEGALLLKMQSILMPLVPHKAEGHGAVELAQAVAELVQAQKIAPPEEVIGVTDEDLIDHMQRTDALPASELSPVVRALCMEVAKLRFQLKAKG